MRAELVLENGWQSWITTFFETHPEGAVVGLSGELGAGKTTFVRWAVRSLAPEGSPRVVSPTYVFHQNYAELKIPIEHFDLYRLESASASTLEELGYYDALARAKSGKGFVFVEWPEKVARRSDLNLTHLLQIEFAPQGRLVQLITF